METIRTLLGVTCGVAAAVLDHVGHSWPNNWPV
jgi:hypothetical protein